LSKRLRCNGFTLAGRSGPHVTRRSTNGGQETNKASGDRRSVLMSRTQKPRDAKEVRRLGETTIAFYDRFARAFWNGTRDHDVSQNYAAFLDAIEGDPPYCILDLGCGPGRDLGYFRSLGHEAIGLDGSRQFTAMARAHSGCEVLHQDFLAMQLPEGRFDGILPTPLCSIYRARNCPGFCWNFTKH
jgi:SAM-dependent methyltransferase